MKTMNVLWVALVLVASAILPVRAQGDTTTVSFAITAAQTPCANATYWALYGLPASEFVAQQLADGDGDGVYTGSVEAEVGGQLAIQLVQGTGVAESIFGPIPGNPSTTIKNFGFVTIEKDAVFSAQATGCTAELPGTGRSDILPVALAASAVLLLAVGVHLRQRVWHATR
jgi:hypothetical protein